MNDEWDLIQLQSITLGYESLRGKWDTRKSNQLIMKSMKEHDWKTRSSFFIYTQRRWWQFIEYGKSDTGEYDIILNLN